MSELPQEPVPAEAPQSPEAGPFNLEAFTPDQIRCLGQAIYTAHSAANAAASPYQPEDSVPSQAVFADEDVIVSLEDTLCASLTDYYRRDPERGLALFERMAYSSNEFDREFALDSLDGLFDSHPYEVLAAIARLQWPGSLFSDAGVTAALRIEPRLSPEQAAWFEERERLEEQRTRDEYRS